MLTLPADYPEEWCTAAIPYPTLKKCLNKIRAELQGLGLDADSLRQLLETQAVLSHGNHIPLAKYKLDGKSLNVKRAGLSCLSCLSSSLLFEADHEPIFQ